MKVYVVLTKDKFLGLANNKQDAENIRKAYAITVGETDPENNVPILEYTLKGE